MMARNLSELLHAHRFIHMDYHNPVFLTEVGRSFNAKTLVQTLKEANVDGLVTSSKCHHGYSYYPTKIGQRHPALKGDMMGDTIEECQRQGITALIYYSVVWDKRIADQSPDWLQRTKDGETISHRVWDFICLNSSYKEEVVFPQLRELLRNYDHFAALWFDIVRMGAEGCYCTYCQRKFQSKHLVSIQCASDSEREEFRIQSVIDFLVETREIIKQEKPEVLLTFNQIDLFRPFEPAPCPGKYHRLWRIVDFIAVESHTPDYGGVPRTLGIIDASLKAKYCRGFGKPFQIILSRFVHSWGAWDVLPLAHLKTIFSQIASNGGIISCGDQLYPEGTISKGVYDLIEKAFRFIMERQQWFSNKEEVPNVCVLADTWDNSFQGACHILTQLQVPFTVRDSSQVTPESLNQYRIVMLSSLSDLRDDTADVLLQYLNRGGKLIADYSGLPTNEKLLESLFGIRLLEQSPYSIGYLDLGSVADGDEFMKIPLLVSGPFVKVRLVNATKILEWIKPRTESTQDRYLRHPNAPPGQHSQFPGAIINTVGRGRAIFVSGPILRDFWVSGHWYLKLVVRHLLRLVEPSPLIRIDGESRDLEVALTRSEGLLQVHLITYAPSPKTAKFSVIEGNPTLHELKIQVSKELIGGSRTAILAPDKTQLHTKDIGDYVQFECPRIEAYNILEIS